MWQREFIITNTLDHKMIYSAVSLLFSLTVNSFDLTEIPLACSSSPSISLAWSLSPFLSDLFTWEWSEEWEYVGADNLVKKIIILLFSVSTRPLFIASSEIIFILSCHSTSSLTLVLLLQA